MIHVSNLIKILKSSIFSEIIPDCLVIQFPILIVNKLLKIFRIKNFF